MDMDMNMEQREIGCGHLTILTIFLAIKTAFETQKIEC